MRSERAPRLPRVRFGRPVSVTPDGDWERPLHLQAANLSLGGMFVYADQQLPLGTHVSLALAAAGRLLDFAEAEVVWVQASSGFGVRFTKLPPRAQALVEHLVARGGTGEPPVASPAPSRWRRGAALSAIAFAATCATLFVLRAPRPRATQPQPPARPTSAQPAIQLQPAEAPHTAPAMSQAPELTAPRAADPAARPYPGEFQVALPTGAVSALQITISDDEVALRPLLHRGAAIQRVFRLASPARLVIDVSGRAPRYSWQLEGTTIVKSVRVGSRNHGTRVVVDLPPDSGSRRYRVVTGAGDV